MAWFVNQAVLPVLVALRLWEAVVVCVDERLQRTARWVGWLW